MSDPRLNVYGPHPDGKPRPARWEYESNYGQPRWRVASTGTKTLGYVYPVGINADGEQVKPHTPTYGTPTPRESSAARHMFQATDRDGSPLDGPVDTVEDAAALIVGNAHRADPGPEHVVPNRGGRPEVGRAINVRLGDELLAKVDAAALRRASTRADTLRDLVDLALSLRTVDVDVVSGRITVAAPDSEDTDVIHLNEKILGLSSDVEPWGEDEDGMDRADAELAEMGWQRIGPWRGAAGETWTAPVEPAA